MDFESSLQSHLCFHLVDVFSGEGGVPVEMMSQLPSTGHEVLFVTEAIKHRRH